MKNPYCRILIFLFSFFPTGFAQITSPDQFRISTGISIPAAPDQFSDYWSDGVHGILAMLYTTRFPYVGVISFDYNYFPFDDSQVIKKLNMKQGSSEVSGAATSNYKLSCGMNYYLQYDPLFTPFVSVGVSISYLRVSESKITYPLSVKTQDSNSKVLLSLYFGGGILFPVYDGMDLVLSMDRAAGAKKDKTINSDYYSIKIGALWEIN